MSSTADPILQAVQALTRLIDERIAAALRSTPATGVKLHSQLDGERPPGVKRTRYLRVWRAGRDAGDPEVYADGRARIMSAAAWARHAGVTRDRRVTSRPVTRDGDVTSLRDRSSRNVTGHGSRPATVRDVDVLSELGLAPEKRCG